MAAVECVEGADQLRQDFERCRICATWSSMNQELPDSLTLNA